MLLSMTLQIRVAGKAILRGRQDDNVLLRQTLRAENQFDKKTIGSKMQVPSENYREHAFERLSSCYVDYVRRSGSVKLKNLRLYIDLRNHNIPPACDRLTKSLLSLLYRALSLDSIS